MLCRIARCRPAGLRHIGDSMADNVAAHVFSRSENVAYAQLNLTGRLVPVSIG